MLLRRHDMACSVLDWNRTSGDGALAPNHELFPFEDGTTPKRLDSPADFRKPAYMYGRRQATPMYGA